MTKNFIMAAAPIMALVMSAGVARATTINLSTGTATYTITSDTNGGLDADYTGTAINVTSLPGGSFLHASNVSDGTDTTSQWIGPNADEASEPSSGLNQVSGTTTYTVTFNLTGLTSPSLIMSLAGDDYVSTVKLNSTTIFTASGNEITDGMWTNATSVGTVTSGFLPGLNTITFTVPNFTTDSSSSCCGPTGLIVAADVTGVSAVPEPATLGLVGLGLLGAGMIRYRIRARK